MSSIGKITATVCRLTHNDGIKRQSLHRAGATTRLRPLPTFLHRGGLDAAPMAEALQIHDRNHGNRQYASKTTADTTLYHQIVSQFKHEKNGQQIDLRQRRGSRTVDERWARERETRHTAEAWFFSFPSVASSKAGQSEYDNLFRRERAPPKEAFPCGNPTGA